MIEYKISPEVSPAQIANLRKSVGWNAMEEYYYISLKNSYFYICCYDNDELVGFIDVVSNRSSDAYIQDLMVNPQFQGKGIGTKLMTTAIDKLKEEKIYMISVLFEKDLLDFYKKFGFNIILSGQMETQHLE